jgi:uncharacterized membrane protein
MIGAKRCSLGTLLGLPFAALAAGSAAAVPSFSGLGIPTGHTHCSANGVSIDGAAVVGSCGGGSAGDEAYVWTHDSAMVSLGPGSANGVSAGGGVVAGGGVGTSGFRWNAAEGRGDLPAASLSDGTAGLGVSADGSVIVGYDYPPAVSEYFSHGPARWTAATGYAFESADVPANIGLDSVFLDLTAVSADGSLSVLAIRGQLGIPREAFLLHADGTSERIGELADNALAAGISSDGAFVVGSVLGASDQEAFLWSSPTGLMPLADLPGGIVQSLAHAVTDNATVVGQGSTDQGFEAFIWDSVLGMRNLRGELVGRGVDLTGWLLTDATGISFDGQIIVGNGVDPDGHLEAWIATIPEPGESSTGATIALGLCVLGVRRSRG